MGLTDREAYLDLRARYLRLIMALRRTQEYNPQTLDAFERVLQPPRSNPRRVRIPFSVGNGAQTTEQERHAA